MAPVRGGAHLQILPEAEAAAVSEAVVIEWAIAVSAAPLRWAIAADLAEARAGGAEGVLVPAAVAAHPAWAVGAAVEAAADLVAAEVVVVAAEAAGGKHHERGKSHNELHYFELALAKTSRGSRDRSFAAHLGADLRSSRRGTNKSGPQGQDLRDA